MYKNWYEEYEEVKSGKLITVLKGHNKKVKQAGFSPDSQRVFTTSDDKTVRLWDANNGKQLLVLEGHQIQITYAAFSPVPKFALVRMVNI